MVLTKEKSALLFEKLEEFCKENKVNMPRNKSIRLNELAKAVIQRYGSVVLMDDKGKRLCNNAKYLKKWTFRESLKSAGSYLKLSNCGEISKKHFKKKQNG